MPVHSKPLRVRNGEGVPYHLLRAHLDSVLVHLFVQSRSQEEGVVNLVRKLLFVHEHPQSPSVFRDPRAFAEAPDGGHAELRRPQRAQLIAHEVVELVHVERVSLIGHHLGEEACLFAAPDVRWPLVARRDPLHEELDKLDVLWEHEPVLLKDGRQPLRDAIDERDGRLFVRPLPRGRAWAVLPHKSLERVAERAMPNVVDEARNLDTKHVTFGNPQLGLIGRQVSHEQAGQVSDAERVLKACVQGGRK
mmetsp:Transcript_16571/g.54100  ORF Transcript_16571/g.54100 Transcript_16571/m.54100 type:complete len:249 (-) Transcript_16571:251-997(-)